MQAHFKLSDVSHLKEETFIQKTPNVSKRNLVNAKNKSFTRGPTIEDISLEFVITNTVSKLCYSII